MVVTIGGIPRREMRLQYHGGQALVLLVVAALTGAVVGGVALERGGLPAPIANRASSLLAPSRSSLPPRIQIGATGAPAMPTMAPSMPPAVRPTPTTAVVPDIIYTYPPGDHQKGGGGSGRRGPG